MTKNLETINNLNELSIKRLFLLESYVKLMESLEANLGEYRFHLSKTKLAKIHAWAGEGDIYRPSASFSGYGGI